MSTRNLNLTLCTDLFPAESAQSYKWSGYCGKQTADDAPDLAMFNYSSTVARNLYVGGLS